MNVELLLKISHLRVVAQQASDIVQITAAYADILTINRLQREADFFRMICKNLDLVTAQNLEHLQDLKQINANNGFALSATLLPLELEHNAFLRSVAEFKTKCNHRGIQL